MTQNEQKEWIQHLLKCEYDIINPVFSNGETKINLELFLLAVIKDYIEFNSTN